MLSTHREIAPTQWEYRLDRSTQPELDGILSTQDQKRISQWTACSQFPTEIHLELMKAGIIPHPYKQRNEHNVQWVGKQHWEFRAKLDVGSELSEYNVCELDFEGLDTFVKVSLNGKEILTGDNHFLPYKVPLKTENLLPSNELLLRFAPAEEFAKALEAEHGKMRAGSCNLGDPSRVYVRKMQACWRWDWGLELMTIGPDRPITLHLAKAKFVEIKTAAIVDEDLSQRQLKVDIKLKNPLDFTVSCRCVLADKLSGTIVKEETMVFGERDISNFKWKLGPEEVALWWPNGQGEQRLYRFESTLTAENGEVLDHFSRNIGFRRARLVQDPLMDQPGKTFLFEINGRRIFAGGSNWIPTDHILPIIEDSRYRALLELAVSCHPYVLPQRSVCTEVYSLRSSVQAKGNQNMIRCWGGGVYEPDIFYDLCDKLGLMVWQDFQFACGIYPAYPDFIKSVEKEAIANVKRLRHHPSLIIFCGNNEDYQQIRQWNIDESQADPLPARKIYEELLPKVVAALTDPVIAYHPGSPNKAADSEFGMPSIPDIRTVDWWLDGNGKERYSQSKLMQQHNRAGSHERRFAVYMNEMFRLTGDFATYIYHTQVLQSESMGFAYRSWRRQWKGPGKEYCAGALVWQLNDSWPVSSWAIIDYFLRPKPAYYSIKRELAPVSVGIQRTVEKNRDNDRPRQFYEYGAFQSTDATVDVWATNDTMDMIRCILEISAYDVETGWSWTSGPGDTLQLAPNSSTELRTAIPVPAPPKNEAADPCAPSGSVVIRAKLQLIRDGKVSNEEAVLASTCDWPQPYKFIDFPALAEQCGLSAKIVSGEDDANIVTLSCAKPIKCLTLGLAEWQEGDTDLDLFPGDAHSVTVKNLAGRRLKATFMGCEGGRKL
ncbi:hypothetical protein QFC22_003583 [Naganishia vaughanmartiniae]|uniref:Uncharacterized protein n=1 Tax=Naganishia vaughanmartiniae TaxID=1424756 RepID=A0ACC2X5A6_9TREE|nr:hypothetical protein QFC22_003583 [Naganishia vaughanmartiniae]